MFLDRIVGRVGERWGRPFVGGLVCGLSVFVFFGRVLLHPKCFRRFLEGGGVLSGGEVVFLEASDRTALKSYMVF